MNDETDHAYIPSLLVQNPLPQRDPGRSTFTRRVGGQEITLTSATGIPFGHVGRMTLALAVTDAVQNRSPRVEMGSVGEWLKRLNTTSTGGVYGSISGLRDQFSRIHQLYINWKLNTPSEGGIKTQSINLPVSSHMEIWWTKKQIDALVPTLFDNYLMFHQEFLAYIIKHSVPVDLDVYNKFQAPLAQDIYAWLSWKLGSLEEPLDLSWAAITPQFSDKVQKNPREWRKRWAARALEVVNEGYPGAHIKSTETGILLFPSPRAIRPRNPGFVV